LRRIAGSHPDPREEEHMLERSDGGKAAVVCADIETAVAALDAGHDVVLIDDDPVRLGPVVAALRGGGRGRLSVFVGDPSASRVWAAASAMAAEQYRSEVVVAHPPPRPLPDDGRVR
jgi:hypothetical protein